MNHFNVKWLYSYKFISQCLPIYAFYTILFIERGKSVSEIAVLIALWSAFTILFEVPAGLLADRWNRRNMLAIATVLQGVCFVIWFFSHTFLMFALGFLCWAVAGAFTDGTEEGLIYDNLKSDGREDDFTAVYGRAQFFGHIGTVVGIGSAGLIAVFVSIEAIALISAGICFANVLFVLRIRERNFDAKRSQEEGAGLFDTFKKVVFFIKGNGSALAVLLFLVFFAGLGSYLDEFDALIANDWTLEVWWVSAILTVRFGFMALGDVLAPKVEKILGSARRIFLFNGLACVVLAVFAAFWHPFALLFFGIAFMMMAMTEILLVNALQRAIKEEGRTTVMSFYSVGQNLVMIGFSLVFALLAGVFTLQQVYMLIAVYGAVGAVVFYILNRFAFGRRL